jgi:hypothetical protein
MAGTAALRDFNLGYVAFIAASINPASDHRNTPGGDGRR